MSIDKKACTQAIQEIEELCLKAMRQIGHDHSTRKHVKMKEVDYKEYRETARILKEITSILPSRDDMGRTLQIKRDLISFYDGHIILGPVPEDHVHIIEKSTIYTDRDHLGRLARWCIDAVEEIKRAR